MNCKTFSDLEVLEGKNSVLPFALMFREHYEREENWRQPVLDHYQSLIMTWMCVGKGLTSSVKDDDMHNYSNLVDVFDEIRSRFVEEPEFTHERLGNVIMALDPLLQETRVAPPTHPPHPPHPPTPHTS